MSPHLQLGAGLSAILATATDAATASAASGGALITTAGYGWRLFHPHPAALQRRAVVERIVGGILLPVAILGRVVAIDFDVQAKGGAIGFGANLAKMAPPHFAAI